MGLIAIIITVLLISSLLLNNKKREIPFGKLVSHKKRHLDDKNYIPEIVKFKNSIECVKYYNKLVAQLTVKVESYEIDDWTINKIETANEYLELFRYGNKIKLVRTTIR